MPSDEIVPGPRLREIARDVQLLLPDRRDPHLFHERKSEIVADLRTPARAIEGHRPVQFHMKLQPVITVSPGLGQLPPIDTSCLFCLRRRASQRRRARLRLPGLDLFQWAERQ
jgi:hypothetical protein